MKVLLGSLLLAGVCWLGDARDIPIMPNFNHLRIAKAWYPLLSIPTGQPDLLPGEFSCWAGEEKRVFCLTVDPEFPGATAPPLHKSLHPPVLGEYGKTPLGRAGDYLTYFIAYITRCSNSDTFLALAGTQPNLTPALETKFRTVANSLGITGEILHSVLEATC
ncbi:ficolin-1-like [Crotalus adamanteus]|uniref:Ficolin-1-like n=1 Tax=Crotalus adamanteus TaxID=8729 RepID=A0AAW1ARX2_CROAD